MTQNKSSWSWFTEKSELIMNFVKRLANYDVTWGTTLTGTPSNVSDSDNSSDIDDKFITIRQPSQFEGPKRNIFPENEVQKLMKWNKNKSKKKAGSGLENLGNSCFINATLQCICYTAPLQNYLVSRQHSNKCRKTKTFCITCEVEKLLPLMFGGSSDDYETPHKIFENLTSISSSLESLEPGRQEDAHEFLRGLLDGLRIRALKTKRLSKTTLIKDPRIQETTIIHKIFGGYIRSQVKCCKCGNETNKYDAILDISLEINNCNSINDALKQYTSNEILNGKNKYFCNRYVRFYNLL